MTLSFSISPNKLITAYALIPTPLSEEAYLIVGVWRGGCNTPFTVTEDKIKSLNTKLSSEGRMPPE